MYIGCKDGALWEVNCKSFKLERAIDTKLPIQSITVMENNTIVLVQSVSSAYLENRTTLQLIKASETEKNEFETLLIEGLANTGDVH